MPLTVVGISHHTAPIELREKVALVRDEAGNASSALRARMEAEEVVILSTCNRTEIYLLGPDIDAPRIMQELSHLRTGIEPLQDDELQGHFYDHRDEAAVRHLFRVASGLDSLVLGEPQILGQVKDAWRLARDAGSLGGTLDRLFQHAFSTAKSVRTETGIGDHPVSVAYTATVLARQIFGDLSAQRVLLVGAGKMIETCGHHFRQQGAAGLTIANRSADRAAELADSLGGLSLALDQLPAALTDADIVVTSTASTQPIIEAAMVKAAMRARRHRPVFIVDIAVPRDVHPDVGQLADVYLYTIDDLQSVVDENQSERERAAERASDGIDLSVNEFMRWLNGSRAAQGLRQLREHFETQSAELAHRAARQIEQGGDPEQVVAQLAHTLTRRFLHGPTLRLRQAVEDGDEEILSAADRLFGPDDKDPENDK